MNDRMHPPAMALSPSLVLDAWRNVPRRVLQVTFFLGIALFVYHFTLRFGGEMYHLQMPASQWLRALARDQLSAFALMACLVVADRVSGERAARRAPYVVAVLVGAAAGTLLAWFTGEIVTGAGLRDPDRLRFFLYVQFESVVIGGAAVFIYADRRRALASVARMHAAELARVEAAKRTLETRLRALQARIEPRFLFDTLADVKRLYRRDPALAERMLDQLIAYLRAAMPKTPETPSTVANEIELVRAYLAIVSVRPGDVLDFSIDVPAGAADIRMPPMLLLPLVHRSIAKRVERNGAGEAASLEITATIAGSRLRIAIGGTAAHADANDIAGIRDRLKSLYGGSAWLAVQSRDAHRFGALLDLPCERSREAPTP